MSTDYLRRLLTELVKIYNPNCDGKDILDMIEQENQFRESEMMTLRQQIHLLRLSLDRLERQSQLLNEIELKLNISDKKLYQDALLENHENTIGVSVLDDEWNFIVMDDISKQLLELHKLKNPNFYHIIPEFSKTQNEYQLKDSRNPQLFKFSVYSKKNRKNAYRKFTRYLKSDMKEIKLKEKFQTKLLHTIYCKQIEATMQRFSIYVDDQFGQELNQLNLQSTHNLKQGWQEVVLVYFKEVRYENHLTLQQVESDYLVNGYQGIKVKAIHKSKSNSSNMDDNTVVRKQTKKQDDSFEMDSFNLDESDYTYSPDHIL